MWWQAVPELQVMGTMRAVLLLLRGIRQSITDKNVEELAEILGDYFPDTTKNDLTETIKRYREADSWYKTTYITKKGFDRVQDIMKNSNKLEKKVPYNKLVITKYSKK